MKNIAQKIGLAAEASEDAILAEVTRLQSRLTTLEPLEAENLKLKNRMRQIDEDAVAGLLAERKIADEKIVNRLKPVLVNFASRAERVAFLDDCGFSAEAGTGHRELPHLCALCDSVAILSSLFPSPPKSHFQFCKSIFCVVQIPPLDLINIHGPAIP